MKSTRDQAKQTENQVLVAAEEEEEEEEEEGEIDRLFVGIMEGYKDYLIPPLSDFSSPTLPLRATPPTTTTTGIYEQGGGSSSFKHRGGAHDHHRKRAATNNGDDDPVGKERKRRCKMAEFYSVLQSMVVPKLHHKATREETVRYTIEYVQKLEKEIARLEDLKITRKSSVTLLPEYSMAIGDAAAKPILSRCTNRNSSVEVIVDDSGGGGVTFFGVESPVRRGLVVGIFRVLERHRVEVLTASVTVDDRQRKLTVTVTAMIGGGNGVGDTIEKIKREMLVI